MCVIKFLNSYPMHGCVKLHPKSEGGINVAERRYHMSFQNNTHKITHK